MSKRERTTCWIITGVMILGFLYFWLAPGPGFNHGCDTTGSPSFQTEQCR